MTETLLPPPQAEAGAYPSLLQRVRETLRAPTRLFASFGDDAPWLGALALATAVAAMAVAAEPAEFYLSQMEDPVNRRGVPVEISSPPEQVVLWGRLMATFSAFVGHPLLGFAAAGFLTVAFRVIGPGDASFRQYLAVASHALLITSAGMAAAVLLRVFTGDPSALPTVGSIAGVSASGWFGNLLHGVNLFTLWTLAVLGAGVAALERNISRTGATAFLCSGYLAMVVTGAFLFRG